MILWIVNAMENAHIAGVKAITMSVEMDIVMRIKMRNLKGA